MAALDTTYHRPLAREKPPPKEGDMRVGSPLSYRHAAEATINVTAAPDLLPFSPRPRKSRQVYRRSP